MEIKIKSIHFDTTEKLQAFIEKKVAKLEKSVEAIQKVEVQLKVTGKRNQQRIIPFGEELAAELRHYMTVRDAQFGGAEGALFLNDKGERIADHQVYGIVRKYLSAVTSLKKRSPHVLRHTFATAMLNNGAGLEEIKNLLGHESVSTTEIYTHTTFEQLKRVYKEAHPRA